MISSPLPKVWPKMLCRVCNQISSKASGKPFAYYSRTASASSSNPKTTLYEKQASRTNVPNASSDRAPEVTTRQVVSLKSSERTIAGEEAPSKSSVKNGTPRVDEWISSKRKQLPSAIDLSEVVGTLSPPYAPPSPAARGVNPPFLRGGKRGGVSLIEDKIGADPGWVKQMTVELIRIIPVGRYTNEHSNIAHELMRYLSKLGNEAATVEALLHRLISEEESSGDKFRLTSSYYTIAIDAWAKEAAAAARKEVLDIARIEMQETAPERAQQILRLMHERYVNRGNKKRARPGVEAFTAVLDAWAQSKLPAAPKRAEQILNWIDRLNVEGTLDFRANVYSFSSVINAYAKQGLAEDAERLLGVMVDGMEMQERQVDNDNEFCDGLKPSEGTSADINHLVARPNVYTFTSVINAWANTNNGEYAAQRANKVFSQLERLHKETGDPDLKPNTVCLTSLMLAWARSGSAKQIKEADQIFTRLKEIQQTVKSEGNGADGISTFSYNNYIYAIAKSSLPDAADRAESLLNDLLEKKIDGHTGVVTPNDTTWTIVAQAFAQKGDGEGAEKIMLRRHEANRNKICESRPTAFFYNTVLNAWSRRALTSPDAVNSCQRLLDWLEEQSKKENSFIKPDVVSYSITLSAWNRSNDPNATSRSLEILQRMEEQVQRGNVNARPNSVAFNVMMATLAKQKEEGSYLEAVKFLERIEALHKEGAYGPILTLHTYNSALSGCAWHGDRKAGEIAENILDRMENNEEASLNPDIYSYNFALAAWARNSSSNDNAPGRAYHVLNRMEDIANANSFKFALTACLNSREEEAIDMALEIIRKMENNYRKSGDDDMKPSSALFRRLLQTVSKQGENASAIAVETLIKEMDELNGCETMRTKGECYAYALTTCASSKDTKRVEVAERLLNRMESILEVPEPVTHHYEAVLLTLSNCHDADIHERASKIYKHMQERFKAGDSDVVPSIHCYSEPCAFSKVFLLFFFSADPPLTTI